MSGTCDLNLNNPHEKEAMSKHIYQEPIIAKKIIKNDLMLYYNSDCNRINETPIEIDDDLYFNLKSDSSAKFKSIISLLEFYISDRLVLNLICI